jgi:hypothetical protein
MPIATTIAAGPERPATETASLRCVHGEGCCPGAVVAGPLVVGMEGVGPKVVGGKVELLAVDEVGPVVVGEVVEAVVARAGRVVVGAGWALPTWVRWGRVNGLGCGATGWEPPARTSATTTPAAAAAARPAVAPT